MTTYEKKVKVIDTVLDSLRERMLEHTFQVNISRNMFHGPDPNITGLMRSRPGDKIRYMIEINLGNGIKADSRFPEQETEVWPAGKEGWVE